MGTFDFFKGNESENNQENNQIWIDVVNMRVNSMPFKLNSNSNEMSYFMSLDELGLAHAEEYQFGEDRIPKEARNEVALNRVEGFLSIRDFIQASGTIEQKFHLDASIIGALLYANNSNINKDLLKYEIQTKSIKSKLLSDIFYIKPNVISVNKLKKDAEVSMMSDFIKNWANEQIEKLNDDRKNRILHTNNYKVKNEEFLQYLLECKNFILVSSLSVDLKNKLQNVISYLVNDYGINNDVDKIVDIVKILESDYNDYIFIHFTKSNFSEGLKHIEILKKFLSYFVQETTVAVYDTFANLFLLNEKLPEAENKILKCLQIDIIKENENSEHYFTAAKIFYKKNDLINGIKYYKKAVELEPNDNQIKDFNNFLIINNIENNIISTAEKKLSTKLVNSKNVVLGQSYYLDPTLETYGKVVSIEQDFVFFELQSESNGYFVDESNNTIGFHASDNIDFIEKNE
jgi:hypothetical protein